MTDLELPSFLRRGDPDCKVEVEVVAPPRRVSAAVEAQRINRECGELNDKWRRRRARKARKDGKIRKAKRAKTLPEHRS